MKLDFEIFHPLDHDWWEFAECRRHYGGIKRHLYLEWEYRTGQEFRIFIYKQLHCRWGFHQMVPYWKDLFSGKLNPPPAGLCCIYCTYLIKTES